MSNLEYTLAFDATDDLKARLDLYRDAVFNASLEAENWLNRRKFNLSSVDIYSTKNDACKRVVIQGEVEMNVAQFDDADMFKMSNALRLVLSLPAKLDAEFFAGRFKLTFFVWNFALASD